MFAILYTLITCTCLHNISRGGHVLFTPEQYDMVTKKNINMQSGSNKTN